MARASLTHSATSAQQQQQQHPAQITAGTGAGFGGLREHIQSHQQPPASSAAAPSAEASAFAAATPPAAARSAPGLNPQQQQQQTQQQQQQQQEPVSGKAADAPRRAGAGVGGAAAAGQPSQQELQQEIEGYVARLDAASVNLLTKQDLVLLEKLGAGAFGTVYKADWGGAQVRKVVAALCSSELFEGIACATAATVDR
jgi:hypothetical protein